MKGEPRISPTSTYIFQDEDIEAYDDLSLTHAMRDASMLIKKRLAEDTREADVTMEDFEFDSLLFGD